MGRSVAADVAIAADRGRPLPDTAVAVVENASLPSRRRASMGCWPTCLRSKARADLTGPVMAVIGDAVAGAGFERSEPLVGTSREYAAGQCAVSREPPMKVLTANRLIDGEAVWFAGAASGSKAVGGSGVVGDKDGGGAGFEAISKAAYENNEVVDVNLIDVEVVGGEIVPQRLRERIRAAGPDQPRVDLGKQARRGNRAA